jgi:hypothetical protein
MTEDREELTVTQAARVTRVDRSTIRRRLDAGDFPNARRKTGRHGPASGPWLIPNADLLAAGLKLHQPNESDGLPTDQPATGSDSDKSLRLALAKAVKRAEVAEAIAAERAAALADVRAALDLAQRMLIPGQLPVVRPASVRASAQTPAGLPLALVTQLRAPDPQPDPDAAVDFWIADEEVEKEPRRRWWQRESM